MIRRITQNLKKSPKSQLFPAIFIAMAVVLSLLGGCRTMDQIRADKPEMMPRFYLSTHGTDADSLTTLVTLPMSQISMFVQAQPVMYEGDVTSVDLVKVDLGYCVSFNFNATATRALYRLAVANQGRNLVLFINGAPIGFRTIDNYFEDGSMMMFLEMPNEDVPEYAEKLQKSIETIHLLKDF